MKVFMPASVMGSPGTSQSKKEKRKRQKKQKMCCERPRHYILSKYLLLEVLFKETYLIVQQLFNVLFLLMGFI